jgi:uncharacterized protein (DUF58 family)
MLIIAIQPERWYMALWVPFGAIIAMLADFLIAMPISGLLTELKVPTQLYVGKPGAMDLTLMTDHDRTVMVDVLPEHSGEARQSEVTSFALNKERAVLLPLIPIKRGKILVTMLWLRWRGPLGLSEMKSARPVDKSIGVVPDIKSVHEAAIQFFSKDAIYGIRTQRIKGEGTEFESLGEYQPGMDNRLIDWKHSARHIKLLCKEFQQERNYHIVLGFDTGHLMLEPVDGMPKLDHAIRAGLLLTWVSLKNGDFVGGCGFDVQFRNFIKPGKGMTYFSQFQRFTTDLKYKTEETNFTLGLTELGTRLQRRSLVVLFTEFVDMISAELLIENLRLMTMRHVVIFVTMRDPMLARLQSAKPGDFEAVAGAVISDDFLAERQVVLERISRLGVHCLDVPANGMSAALLNRYLMIKNRGLL